MGELVIERSGGVLRLTLNAPTQLNSVTTPLLHDLADAVGEGDRNRVAILRGSGAAFSSGARLSEGGPNAGILEAAERVVTAITNAPFPVVAAVDGPAAGLGCSLALAADLVVASERSYFLQAFVRVGLMPDGAATETLAASVGRARAMWLLMSGERIGAAEAFRIGLIGSCVHDDEFDPAVEALVERLATGPTLALARTKRAVNAATLHRLEHTLAWERREQTALLDSRDYAEGVAAFKEKRAARFDGR